MINVILVSLLMTELVLVTRWLSGGFFSIVNVVMLYIVSLYVGGVSFYLDAGHLTYLFVFAMAVCYVIGAAMVRLLPLRQSGARREPVEFYSRFERPALIRALVGFNLVALGVAAYRFETFGIPLLTGDWYGTSGVWANTGLFNQLVQMTGSSATLISAAVWYALHQIYRRCWMLVAAALAFLLACMFLLLQGSKGAALEPGMVMLVAIFYARRAVGLATLVAFGALAVAVAVVVGSFWMKFGATNDIAKLYFSRATSGATETLDYVLYGWSGPYQQGATFGAEVGRVHDQLAGTPKKPLFNQVIANEMQNWPVDYYTPMAPELTLFGVGYVNFGTGGAVVAAVLLGMLIEGAHVRLTSVGRMAEWQFAVRAQFIQGLIHVAKGGTLMALEGTVIPLVLFLGIVLALYLLQHLLRLSAPPRRVGDPIALPSLTSAQSRT
jgi:hypothetical protein